MRRGVVFSIFAVIGILVIGGTSVYMFGSIPPLPQDVPDGVHVFSISGETVTSDGQAFIVSYNRSYTLTTKFEQRESLNGLWSGSSTLKIVSPTSEKSTFNGEKYSRSWGSEIEGVEKIPTQSFTPMAKVTFSLGARQYHQWVNAQVEGLTEFPVRSATPGYFYDGYASGARNVTLFVVSPEEYAKAVDHQLYEATRENLALNGVITFLFGGLPLMIGGFGLYTVARPDSTRELKGTITECGRRRDAKAVAPLIRLVTDKDQSETTRIYSARALGMIGDIRAVEPLIAQLDDRGESVPIRVSVIGALGKLKDARARSSLREAAASGDQRLRIAAKSALRELDK